MPFCCFEPVAWLPEPPAFRAVPAPALRPALELALLADPVAFRPEPAACPPEPAAVLRPEPAAFAPEPAAALPPDPAFEPEPAAALPLEPAFEPEPAAAVRPEPAARRPEPAAVLRAESALLAEPVAFLAEPAALRPGSALFVFDDVAISVLLAAPAARDRLALGLTVPGEIPELLPGRFQNALCLVLGTALLHVSDQLRQARLVLGDVQPVDCLGEPEVGIHAGDDDARVDGQKLDADQRNPHVRVDDQPLIQDRVDDVSEARR